jgi:hypothetical protein
MIDAFSLPHVLLVRVLDEAAVSDKKILEGELPKRMMVGKPGRVVEIEGWSNSQSDFDAMEALVDGTVRTFYHPDGDSFAAIVTGFNESKDATSYDQRGYRITLMETR